VGIAFLFVVVPAWEGAIDFLLSEVTFTDWHPRWMDVYIEREVVRCRVL